MKHSIVDLIYRKEQASFDVDSYSFQLYNMDYYLKTYSSSQFDSYIREKEIRYIFVSF
jgi:hypothetical protein